MPEPQDRATAARDRLGRYSATQVERVASILLVAREAITEEGMQEFSASVITLVELARAASRFQQSRGREEERELLEAITRFGDV